MSRLDSMKEFADRAESNTGSRFGGPLPSDRDRARIMSDRLGASERKADVAMRDRLNKIARR